MAKFKSSGAMGDTAPVNPSKQPKGTIFGASMKPMKKVPMKTKKKMSKALSRNYS